MVLRVGKALILTVLLTALTSNAQAAGADVHDASGMTHDFSEVERFAARFESPERAAWQRPDQVVSSLELKPGQSVADIGAGSGYFARRFAHAVAPGGTVLALDTEPGMVEYMTKDARDSGLANYRPRVVKPDDPGIEPGSVDLIFICNTYHHIKSRPDYFRRLAPALKPGGRIVIVDYVKDEIPVGPPPEHKIAREVVIEELREGGYRLVRSHEFLPYQHFLEFEIETRSDR